MQWPAGQPRAAHLVGGAGPGQGARGIEGDDGVEPRVDLLDARQRTPQQLLAADAARRQRRQEIHSRAVCGVAGHGIAAAAAGKRLACLRIRRGSRAR
ncbi:MAG: hypothetical protein M5R42_10060 [Rhodocyclaceae bacterium]|nr:hypothetical protein [Rhodocyclaceae bacterium]